MFGNQFIWSCWKWNKTLNWLLLKTLSSFSVLNYTIILNEQYFYSKITFSKKQAWTVNSTTWTILCICTCTYKVHCTKCHSIEAFNSTWLQLPRKVANTLADMACTRPWSSMMDRQTVRQTDGRVKSPWNRRGTLIPTSSPLLQVVISWVG